MTKKITLSKTMPPLALSASTGGLKVKLQAWDVVDCQKLQDLVQINARALCHFMPWIHYPMSYEELVQWIGKARADYFSGTSFLWAIIDASKNEIIGNISLRPLGQYRNPNAMEIGYWMDVAHCKKGFTTQATKMVVALGFELFGLDRIQISCNKENIASRRVIEKCGFHFEGEVRNCFCRPTEKMVSDGYVQERTELSYALIPEDRPTLDWYQELARAITLETITGDKTTL